MTGNSVLLGLGVDLAGHGIRVATVTLAGQIVPGTPFDAERIAERDWTITNASSGWRSEFRFEGA